MTLDSAATPATRGTAAAGEGPDGRPVSRDARAWISPALVWTGASRRAFELKFLLAETLALEVQEWAGRHLTLDPHGDPALAGAYQIHSLYLDTPEHDVFHRNAPHKRSKYRLRRYGHEGGVYLERKSKSGQRVGKRRSWLPLAELERLAQPALASDWPGQWFQRRLESRGLGPACLIRYLRLAFVGSGEHGPIRLTLDRQVHSLAATGWALDEQTPPSTILEGSVILELKYRGYFPALFKRLLHEHGLAQCRVSKYRLAMRSLGLVERPREVG